MLQVTIDLELLDEKPAEHTFDVVSVGHHNGVCIITFVDERAKGLPQYYVVSTDSVFFMGLA